MTNTIENRSVEIDILIAKIEKMWRRANHPNTPPAEREVAETKALALMEQHRINKAMLDLDETDELGDHYFGVVRGSYGLLHLNFINAVAAVFDCRVWWRSYGMRYETHITGFRSDFERVKALVTFLYSDAVLQSRKFKSRSRAITLDYRRSFIVAYKDVIERRLYAAHKVARDGAVSEHGSDKVTGAELVLVERKERVDEFYSTKKMRSRSLHRHTGSSRGHADGHAAGTNVDLSNRRRVTTGVKALSR